MIAEWCQGSRRCSPVPVGLQLDRSVQRTWFAELSSFPSRTRGHDEDGMSYIQQVLQTDETMRFRTTVHWSIYLAAIIALLIGLAFLAWHYVEGKANLLLLLRAIVFGVTGIIVAVAAGLKRFGT